MLKAKRSVRYAFLVLIIILVIFSHLLALKAEETASMDSEIPIYQIPISERTQQDIGKLCEEKELSYEFVLAIFHVEGIQDVTIDTAKIEIEKIVDLRDYWKSQGYPDEIIFDLLLLSRERGIQGCLSYLEASDANNMDAYVQKVTEYKYKLEQSLDEPSILVAQ